MLGLIFFFRKDSDVKYCMALYPQMVNYRGQRVNCEIYNVKDVVIPGIPNLSKEFKEKIGMVAVDLTDGLYIQDGELIDMEGKEDVEVFIVPDGVRTLTDELFKDCVNLRRIIFPSSLIEICFSCFKNCKNLEEIQFPKGLQIINREAFKGCVKLKEIILPASVTRIGIRAFEDCSILEIFKFEGVPESIGSEILRNCYNLEPIFIPKGIRFMSSSVFAYTNAKIYVEEGNDTSEWSKSWYFSADVTNGVKRDEYEKIS